MPQEMKDTINKAQNQQKHEDPPDMTSAQTNPIHQPEVNAGKGPKYFVTIEGVTHEWDKPTITTEEIIQLGNWDPGQGVIEVDADQNERTLSPGEVIELKPGHGFGKKLSWKRG